MGEGKGLAASTTQLLAHVCVRIGSTPAASRDSADQVNICRRVANEANTARDMPKHTARSTAPE